MGSFLAAVMAAVRFADTIADVGTFYA